MSPIKGDWHVEHHYDALEEIYNSLLKVYYQIYKLLDSNLRGNLCNVYLILTGLAQHWKSEPKKVASKGGVSSSKTYK
jgi:uncharacterized protein YgbK (DUF1537 family)